MGARSRPAGAAQIGCLILAAIVLLIAPVTTVGSATSARMAKALARECSFRRNAALVAILIVSSGRALVPKRVPLPPPGFDDLSVDEKIDYVQSLWDRIAASPETIPVPGWHREILDQRVKDLEDNPEAGDSWDVVQERIRRTLDSKP